MVLEGFLFENFFRQSDATPKVDEIFLISEVVVVNGRVLERVFGLEFHTSSTGGPHCACVRLEGVTRTHLLTVVYHNGGNEVKLDVWVGHRGGASKERSSFEVGGGGCSGLREEPLHARHSHLHGELPLVGVECDGLGALVL